MQPTRLLLVDDEEEFVSALSERLSVRGYEVRTALNGRDGLAVIEEGFVPDVVLLDVKMPGMDGVEVLHRIKEQQPLIQVVLLTGHATVDSAVQGMKEGAYDYIMKPADFAELIGKIDTAAVRKREHEQEITEIRQTPYLSPREQEEKVAAVIARAKRNIQGGSGF